MTHKTNWIATNWFKVVLLLFLVGTVGLEFYWFSFRPTEIKKQCSFVTKTRPAIPYRAAMTEEQMQKAGMIHDCREIDINSPAFDANGKELSSIDKLFLERRSNVLNQTCLSDNKKRIAHYTKEQKAEPAKQYQDKATDDEYSQCLRENGL